jgi:hypothetical protein
MVMRPVDTGVQWTSRVSPRARLVAAVIAATLVIPGIVAPTPAAASAPPSRYLLMSRSALLARPVSGTAWSNLRAVAAGPLGTPNLCDLNNKHHLRTLAAALVFARTGIASYGVKARSAVVAAIRTQRNGCHNATLAMGRQLMAYVLAADFAQLTGTGEASFRSFLTTIRRKVIGGHSIWNSLFRTHVLSATNWGAYAGASRIAADLYLGDRTDLASASRITRGFLGDRSAFRFTDNMSSTALSWACAPSIYTPVNGSCTKGGINVDGAVIGDISRGGSLRWPPGSTGVQYQLESIQGLGMQVELLYQNGYSTAWQWSVAALRRMANIVTRSKSGGGTGWNETTASRQMPWVLDKRLGMAIPRVSAGMGRAIGFTDWIYGA